MKKFIILFFLPVYLFALAVPFLPYINYSLNKSFISKNLCENRNKPQMHCMGKCYLAKKLKAQQEEEQKTPSNLKIIEDIIMFCSTTTSTLTAAVLPENSLQKTPYLLKSYSQPLAGIFQPPQ